MKSFLALPFTALLLSTALSLRAETWQLASGDGSWGTAANWSPASVPNAVGASATFDSPTGTRQVTLGDTNSYTVGSLNLTNNSGSSTTIRNNASQTRGAASLTFDEAGSGPVVITVNGTGTNSYLVTADMVFNDNVTVNVLGGPGSSAGLISLTGDITGTGGLTKDGPGQMTMAFIGGQTAGIKEFQGPTVINNGRFRHSFGGTPTKTSSVTVNNGGQIDLITNGSTYTYGTSSATPLNLNGFGPTTGQFAPFPGAIRPDTGLTISITNNVVLQSDSMIHVQGSASGVLTLTGAVSGPGRLVIGSIPHDTNLGKTVLQGTNTYTGGTTVQAGTLQADAISTSAFGTGTIQATSASSVFGGSQAHILITAGATDAIANTAYLNLAGGNAAGIADDGYIDLDAGINETVGGLMLGGVIQPAGTYGATGSAAANINDEYFAGAGIITNAAAGIPGDYNGNGFVDAADYVKWRAGGPLLNDFTPGNQPADYDFWRSRFGATTNPGSGSGLATSAIPEPASIALTGFFVSLLIVTAGRRFTAAN